jgi:Secretion system C-terminal sorting domain
LSKIPSMNMLHIPLLLCLVIGSCQLSAQSCARTNTLLITIKAKCQPTPVQETEEDNPIHVFPNPTCGDVIVNGSFDKNIIIHNMFGQSVFQKTVTELPYTINMRSFLSGVYILTIYGEATLKSVRILKE